MSKVLLVHLMCRQRNCQEQHCLHPTTNSRHQPTRAFLCQLSLAHIWHTSSLYSTALRLEHIGTSWEIMHNLCVWGHFLKVSFVHLEPQHQLNVCLAMEVFLSNLIEQGCLTSCYVIWCSPNVIQTILHSDISCSVTGILLTASWLIVARFHMLAKAFLVFKFFLKITL